MARQLYIVGVDCYTFATMYLNSSYTGRPRVELPSNQNPPPQKKENRFHYTKSRLANENTAGASVHNTQKAMSNHSIFRFVVRK